MYCSNCGEKTTEGMTFCSACGSALYVPVSDTTKKPDLSPSSQMLPSPTGEPNSTQPATTDPLPLKVSAPRKKAPKRIIIAFTAILLLVAIVLVVYALLQPNLGSNNTRFEHYLAISGEDQSFFYNASNQSIPVDGIVKNANSSMDGKVVALLTGEDMEPLGTLYVYDGKDMEKISDDVQFYTISDSGTKILYMTDYEDIQTTATLRYYDIETSSDVEVCEDAVARCGAVLSPDGESYGYCAGGTFDFDLSPTGYLTYLVKNGEEPEEFDDGRNFVLISDDAKLVYYFDWEPDQGEYPRFIMKQGNTTTDLGEINDRFQIISNRDGSEVLYSINGKAYLVGEGGEKTKVMDDPVLKACPSDAVHYTYGFNGSFMPVFSYNYFFQMVQRIDTAHIDDLLLICNDFANPEIRYLDATGEVRDIDAIAPYLKTQYPHEIWFSKDNQSICFINENKDITIILNYRDTESKPITIDLDEDALRVVPTPDFSAFYVVDNHATLFSCRLNEDPVQIGEDASPDMIIFSSDGSRLFYVVDVNRSDFGMPAGTLYCVSISNGAEAIEIDENVYSISSTDAGVAYYAITNKEDYRKEAFYSSDGQTFEKILKDAPIIPNDLYGDIFTRSMP